MVEYGTTSLIQIWSNRIILNANSFEKELWPELGDIHPDHLVNVSV